MVVRILGYLFPLRAGISSFHGGDWGSMALNFILAMTAEDDQEVDYALAITIEDLTVAAAIRCCCE